MDPGGRYKLTVENRDAYVFARVKGKEPPSGRSATYLEAIADYCFRCQCSAILIEKYTPQPFAVWDTFRVAPRLADIGPPHVKIAVVEKGAPPPPTKELTVTIGHERSLDVHVFTDISQAKTWLLSV